VDWIGLDQITSLCAQFCAPWCCIPPHICCYCCYCYCRFMAILQQGRNNWGVWGSGPPKIWTDHPNFFDEECDYHYVTHCSARKWVYHPYFVLYNNLDQGIGPPTLKTWLRPCFRWGARWRHLASTIEPSTGDGDAALCQITLTSLVLLCYFARHCALGELSVFICTAGVIHDMLLVIYGRPM